MWLSTRLVSTNSQAVTSDGSDQLLWICYRNYGQWRVKSIAIQTTVTSSRPGLPSVHRCWEKPPQPNSLKLRRAFLKSDRRTYVLQYSSVWFQMGDTKCAEQVDVNLYFKKLSNVWTCDDASHYKRKEFNNDHTNRQYIPSLVAFLWEATGSSHLLWRPANKSSFQLVLA